MSENIIHEELTVGTIFLAVPYDEADWKDDPTEIHMLTSDFEQPIVKVRDRALSSAEGFYWYGHEDVTYIHVLDQEVERKVHRDSPEVELGAVVQTSNATSKLPAGTKLLCIDTEAPEWVRDNGELVKTTDIELWQKVNLLKDGEIWIN